MQESDHMHCPRLTDLPVPPKGKTRWPWTEETARLPDLRHDGSEWPRISIVTPSYNQGAFIEETIRSVLLQGYPDLEYIIIDGGSTDETVGLIKKYEQWLTLWVSEPDEGQSDAINKGFEKTSGTVISWLNSDDFLAREALGAIGEAFADADETVGAVVGKGYKIDEDYRILISSPLSPVRGEALLRLEMTFLQPSCFFLKAAWDKFGPLRKDLHFCMDHAFWIEMSKKYKFKTIQSDVAYAHTHKDAKTTAYRKRMYAELALAVAQHPAGFAGARQLAMDLVDGKLVSDWVPTRTLAKELVRRIVRRLRITSKGSNADDFHSAEYWEMRYQGGGNSGAGSYNKLAQFKADFLNHFVEEYGVSSVIELGMGDGSQLKLARYPAYTGVDVSQKAVKLCNRAFAGDVNKRFYHQSDLPSDLQADLAISLDVVFHLVEYDVYDSYLRQLFGFAQRFVIIYSSNYDETTPVSHVRHREFTRWIEEFEPNWHLQSFVKNVFPYNPSKPDDTSFSDFYVFARRPLADSK